MTADVTALADALLFEGYLLYPYQRSALKNRWREPLGTLLPAPFCEAHQAGDRSFLQLECLAMVGANARLEFQLRFLQHEQQQATLREIRTPAVTLSALNAGPMRTPFQFPPISGELLVTARALTPDTLKLTVRVSNQTAFDRADLRQREEALLHALAAPHLLLSIVDGTFVSLIDPPPALREPAADCRNTGTWPVLVGDPTARDTLLASPIILYDYPRIAPESPGDFFDATDIDELLTLRILTLADHEKREMARTDERARALLERTEAFGHERLRTLHGAVRGGTELRPGRQVRLRPSARADILDLALTGKLATVQKVECDLEGRIYLAVTVDDDPGKDLGAYGHRFFFRPEEVEPL